MADPIDDVKARLSERYLGKSGVHGIGINRSQNVLRVYVHTEPGSDVEALRRRIVDDAKPYKVVVVEEDRPHIT